MYNGCRTDVLYNVKDRFLVFIEHQSTVNPSACKVFGICG